MPLSSMPMLYIIKFAIQPANANSRNLCRTIFLDGPAQGNDGKGREVYSKARSLGSEWLPPSLSGAQTNIDFVAEGFCRDVLHILWNLSKNVVQMTAADDRFA